MKEHLSDPEWEANLITEVTRSTSRTDGKDYYTFTLREPTDPEKAGGMGIMADVDVFEEAGVTPEVNDALWLCGTFGRPVRGMMLTKLIDSATTLIYYRTPAEEEERNRRMVDEMHAAQRAQFEATGRAILDAKYDALPQVFKDRIDKYRRNNPDFRWKYEGYEMFCCTEAVKLATHALSLTDGDQHVAAETLRALATSEAPDRYEQQRIFDTAAGLDDGHSGNTHGTAWHLAWMYLSHPDLVEKRYGAIAPLVGSEEVGDVPKGQTEGADVAP